MLPLTSMAHPAFTAMCTMHRMVALATLLPSVLPLLMPQVCALLWVLCEISIVALDLTMLLGTAPYSRAILRHGLEDTG